jgi:hypothetical protein
VENHEPGAVIGVLELAVAPADELEFPLSPLEQSLAPLEARPLLEAPARLELDHFVGAHRLLGAVVV